MMTHKNNSLACVKDGEITDENAMAKATEDANQIAKPLCKLDENDRLNLQDALLSLNGSIGQEQAWALCYQTARVMSQQPQLKYYEISELSQLYLHKDGDVWIDDLTDSSTVSEQKAVFSLGMIVFKALDFGLEEEEEIVLSPALEELITMMTSCNQDSEANTEKRLQETDDEGIERDSGEGDVDELLRQETEHSTYDDTNYDDSISTFSLKHVLSVCTKHAQSTNEYAEAHYRAVIRAFVVEALELSKFLKTVATEKSDQRSSPPNDGTRRGSASLHHLDTLSFNDWTDIRIWRAIQARFWVQVISELRKGVKLKKVKTNSNSRERGRGRGTEFELTPHEILMDDIRKRRYRLRKTPLPTPNLKKDAHAVILEFIRSRPTLKKASERQLPPLQKECTLRELLMESIKKPPKPLRSSRTRQQVITVADPATRNGGESRRIVLGEVPPSQPEQEQESAQDVAAQWLQTDDQITMTVVAPSRGEIPNVTPIPQPRQRLGKADVRVPGTRNQQNSGSPNITENGSPTAPKPSRRDYSDSSNARRTRKVIPVDFDLKLDAEDEDDDEDYNEEFTVTRFEEEEAYDYPFEDRDSTRNGHKDHDHREDDDVDSANPWRKTGGLRLTRNEYHRFCDTQLESYDLATQCPSRRASVRKHTARRNLPITSFTGTTSLPHSRPQSRQHTNMTGSTLSPGTSPNISLNPSPSLSPQPRARQPRRSHTVIEGKDPEDQNSDWREDGGQKATLGDMFLDERLSLTLEEIVHIRSVLTKAELESLPVEGRVKEDVEKRRVCFLCLKTRFGLLGPWGQRCRLCERTVCVKCYSKMRIPTEHFAHVPVVLLSPGLLLSPSASEPDTSGKNPWLRGAGAVGSAPASPASRRKDSALRGVTPASTPATTPVSVPTPISTPPSHLRRDVENYGLEKRCYKGSGSPAALSTTKTFSTYTGPSSEQRLAAERLRSVAMVVCHDCRIMVIQIIKSSRTTRATIRNNVISRLTLNLSPAYV